MIKLENNDLLVRIGTGRGARIEHFIDKKTGKDWVWRPATKEPTEARQDLDLHASFDEHWAGGWEEVFPNDAAVEVEGHRLVDHGELWRRRWHQERADAHEAVFSFECESYPMKVMKRFSLHPEGAQLTVEYTLESRHDRPLPFIFKFHPALAIEPGDRFHLPPSSMEPVALGFSRIIGTEEKCTFPVARDAEGRPVSIDLALADDGHKREFVKMGGLPEGHCALQNHRTGKELTLQFPHEFLPYVWLFQSYGGFMGHYVAMLEPTNAGHYDLLEAHRKGACGRILPKERKTVALSMRLRDLC